MKLTLALVLLSIPATAEIIKKSRLGPAVASLTSTNNTAADAGQTLQLSSGTFKNCLSRISVVASSTATLRILDGGTTVYAQDLAAATPFNDRFNEDEMCNSSANFLSIKISTAAKAATLGTQQISYTGFTY